MLTFLGIGAQKAGTSWLYENLKAHPDLHFPAGKEIHFWDAHRKRGLDWYRGLFSSADICEGEVTPAYAFQPREVIADIHAAFPHLRLFFIMRNPIDRAWSSALMALQRSEMSISEASDQWFLDHFQSSSSLLRGNYERSIRNWLSIFSEQQLLLLFFDDLPKDGRLILRRCAAHIGVDPEFFVNSPEDNITTKVFEGISETISPALERRLLELDSEKITSLSRYLETDLGHWLPGSIRLDT